MRRSPAITASRQLRSRATSSDSTALGVTPVRLVHLLELQSALAAAYEAAGRATPRWTDTTPGAGATRVRGDLEELRAAMVAL